eukprot:gene34891-7515_t
MLHVGDHPEGGGNNGADVDMKFDRDFLHSAFLKGKTKGEWDCSALMWKHYPNEMGFCPSLGAITDNGGNMLCPYHMSRHGGYMGDQNWGRVTLPGNLIP